jgi:hypothetical protein
MKIDGYDMTVCFAEGGLWFPISAAADAAGCSEQEMLEWLEGTGAGYADQLTDSMVDAAIDIVADGYRSTR